MAYTKDQELQPTRLRIRIAPGSLNVHTNRAIGLDRRELLEEEKKRQRNESHRPDARLSRRLFRFEMRFQGLADGVAVPK